MEVAGFAKSAMAHSLGTAGTQPDGQFTQTGSGTQFEIRTTSSGVWQSFRRGGESGKLRVEYTIGSGTHATGFLAEVGDHLFQSPLSFYTSRQAWDVAPGYEQSPAPDFSRPVTTECLTCHSGKALPVPDTLNSYRTPPFAEMAITCDRCHGSAEAHLKRPVPGSIINPAKLPNAERDSVCEQCHLAGEIRIPNPRKTIAEFQAGQRTEDVFTVYVSSHPAGKEIKVISHSEQLAQSVCARSSGGKLWCGTCHDPHDKPAQPAAYFRTRCLTCHGAKLSATHAGQDCVGCHMPKRPAKDGGHTAFTDHRITRRMEPEGEAVRGEQLRAWREAPPEFRERNLAMALVTEGMENGVPDQVIEGYRMLNRMEGSLTEDAPALTELGTVLLTAKQPKEAERRFRLALQRRPNFAPYEVNLGGALLEEGTVEEAVAHLERAVQLDALLPQAIHLLSRAYRVQGQTGKAAAIEARYRAAMGITESSSDQHPRAEGGSQ